MCHPLRVVTTHCKWTAASGWEPQSPPAMYFLPNGDNQCTQAGLLGKWSGYWLDRGALNSESLPPSASPQVTSLPASPRSGLKGRSDTSVLRPSSSQHPGQRKAPQSPSVALGPCVMFTPLHLSSLGTQGFHTLPSALPTLNLASASQDAPFTGWEGGLLGSPSRGRVGLQTGGHCRTRAWEFQDVQPESGLSKAAGMGVLAATWTHINVRPNCQAHLLGFTGGRPEVTAAGRGICTVL